MTRSELLGSRLDRLVADFARYVAAYDERVPFTSDQLAAHRETIALRRAAGAVKGAVADPAFVASLRRTLLAWGIGGRGSYLVPPEEFARALEVAVPRLEPLEDLVIDASDLPNDLIDQLWLAVDSLGVVENKAKLVAGTKALHHLLPDLVFPMDRAWTGTYFQLHPPEWQAPADQRRTFWRVYGQLADVARRVDPAQYVTGEGWRTSRTKILDNALIGFCKLELAAIAAEGEDAVVFEVPGYPPAKDQALSVFGAGHAHAPRVRSLLESAERARDAQRFRPVENEDVALEVVLHAPTAQPAWDATNYLGGIADVLEDKSRRSALAHLGDLAAVWLYRNDRQIKEITYREVRSEEPGYSVSVRVIDPRPALRS